MSAVHRARRMIASIASSGVVQIGISSTSTCTLSLRRQYEAREPSESQYLQHSGRKTIETFGSPEPCRANGVGFHVQRYKRMSLWRVDWIGWSVTAKATMQPTRCGDHHHASPVFNTHKRHAHKRHIHHFLAVSGFLMYLSDTFLHSHCSHCAHNILLNGSE